MGRFGGRLYITPQPEARGGCWWVVLCVVGEMEGGRRKVNGHRENILLDTLFLFLM